MNFSDTRIIAHFCGFYKDFSGKSEKIVLLFPTTIPHIHICLLTFDRVSFTVSVNPHFSVPQKPAPEFMVTGSAGISCHHVRQHITFYPYFIYDNSAILVIPTYMWEILYHVAKSTTPVWGSPKIDWNFRTASAVAGP